MTVPFADLSAPAARRRIRPCSASSLCSASTTLSMNVSTSTSSKAASSSARTSISGLTQRAHRREFSCPIPQYSAEVTPVHCDRGFTYRRRGTSLDKVGTTIEDLRKRGISRDSAIHRIAQPSIPTAGSDERASSELRARAAAEPSRIACRGPLRRPAKEQTSPAALADEHAGESVRLPENAAEYEAAFLPHLDLDPASRRATAIDRLRIFRDDPP